MRMAVEVVRVMHDEQPYRKLMNRIFDTSGLSSRVC
jgi:hypothetical protein